MREVLSCSSIKEVWLGSGGMPDHLAPDPARERTVSAKPVAGRSRLRTAKGHGGEIAPARGRYKYFQAVTSGAPDLTGFLK